MDRKNMDSDERSSEEKVRELFDSRAVNSPDRNAVLDASGSEEVRFQNVFRDFLTKRLAVRALKPHRGESLLDFGCGVGRLSEHLAPCFGTITGVDMSEKMLRVAKESSRHPNVSYEHVSVLSGLADGVYDKSMSFWVLQHILDPDALGLYIDTLSRLLKLEGRAFVFEQVRKVTENRGDVLLQRAPDEYITEFSRRGFRLIETRSVFRFPSYGMDAWKRMGVENWLTLRLAELLERLTAARKLDDADYWTQMFVFKKVGRLI